MTPQKHPVFRSLNKPLTILGVERCMFFLAAVIGAATFNLLGSFVSGLLMFAVLYVAGLKATAYDPQALRILLNSSRAKVRYDPLRLDSVARVEILR